MPTYEYRCETDGTFDVSLPMGTAGPTRACPTCRGDASRVFTAPRISTAPRHVMAAIDNAARTSESPDVVTSIPSAGARRRTPMAPANPALQRLPRP